MRVPREAIDLYIDKFRMTPGGRKASCRRYTLAHRTIWDCVPITRIDLADSQYRSEKQSLYFLQRETGGLIKIGISEDVKRRMRDIERTSKSKVKILAILQNKGGKLEWDLMVHFRHLHCHGEWFRPGPDLIDFINSLKR